MLSATSPSAIEAEPFRKFSIREQMPNNDCCNLLQPSVVPVSVCNLKQWALDFDGNERRVIESIRQSKAAGAKIRLGPELELSGYGCEDHFLESDTCFHCWESLAAILSTDITNGILCDIGMPVMHKSVRYNCRVICFNQQIILIRPKCALADDENQRESRWFAPWDKGPVLEEFILPKVIQDITGKIQRGGIQMRQTTAPIGIGIISCRDALVGIESCEELWTPKAPHVDLSLDGAEIFLNGSGSFHQLRKLDTRLQLIMSATQKTGGIYLYANQSGCDGGRLYYDGCSMIAVNGEVVGMASQFTPKEVEIVTKLVSLDAVRSFRASRPSRCSQASSDAARVFPRVNVDLYLGAQSRLNPPSKPISPLIHSPVEEISLGPAFWLWDILRNSKAAGFFVPLSGGADSASVAAIVGSMCQQIMKRVHDGDEEVSGQLKDVLSRVQCSFPKTARDLAGELLHTCYLGTANSSSETRAMSRAVADDVGAFHYELNIDQITESFLNVFSSATGKSPQFLNQTEPEKGGTLGEDLALQNIQARSRMCLSYMLASLMMWVRGKAISGQPSFLFVLATGNVDELLRGYLTKYDCSSGDLNPIGGISKVDLKNFLRWASQPDTLGYSSLSTVVAAPPTAELRPIVENEAKQTDEIDMGMTYEQLSTFGRLRKVERCGPVQMFQRLLTEWIPILSPSAIAEKVKYFFTVYTANRHKATVITPSYHAEAYSPDDNRFDLRPFIYPRYLSRQFADIDSLVTFLKSDSNSDSD